MNIIIKTKEIELTGAIEGYIQKKMESLARFIKDANRELSKAEIEISRGTRHAAGDIFSAQINLSFGGKMFRAQSQQDTLYAAIDETRDDLELQIKKFKTKRETIFIRGARSLKKRFSVSPLARFRRK